MGYTDVLNQFSRDEDLAGISDEVVVASDSIDLNSAVKKVGIGQPVRIVVVATEDFESDVSDEWDYNTEYYENDIVKNSEGNLYICTSSYGLSETEVEISGRDSDIYDGDIMWDYYPVQVTVTLKGSADNTTFGTTYFTKTFEFQDIVAGKILLEEVLPKETLRYIRCEYTVDDVGDEGVLLDAGKVTSFLHLGWSER